MSAAKVCILTSQFYPVIGGTERQIEQLAGVLKKNGQQVFVITTRPPGSSSFEEYKGIEVYRVLPFATGGGRLRSLSYTMRFMLAVLWQLIIYRNRYDIIQSQQAFYATMIAIITAKVLHKKVIFKLSCGGPLGDISLLKRSHFSGIKLALLRKADAYVAISREIKEKELAANGFTANKIHYIPNGVDTQRFKPVEANEKSRLKTELKLTGEKILITVGRVDPQKRLNLLLALWNGIYKELKDFCLLIITPQLPEDIRALIKKVGLSEKSVSYRCRVDDMEKYLQAADIFILVSYTEGLSNSLLEAMAAGLPSIATAVGGTLDLVESGKNGLLVPVDNIEQIRQAVIDLAGDEILRKELGKVARITVEQNYSLDQTALAYRQLYQSLME